MKIVMIVNRELPAGLAVNTAAVLGISLGSERNDIVGVDCTDKSGVRHKGITEFNIPVLVADSTDLKKIYHQCIQSQNISVIDFNRIAQSSRTYSDYVSRLSEKNNNDMEFSGLCLSGPEKEISSFTGSLALFR